MNKIEKSIIDNLNGVTSKKGIWKLFSSRWVSDAMELKSDREKKIYEYVSELLKDNDTCISVISTKQFKSMFVSWDNDKLIENVSILVSDKEIEKALKFYFKENHLNLNRYFCLAMNEKDDKNIFIVSVCRESGIYKFKETKEKEASTENNNLEKISKLLNSIVSLASNFSDSEKMEIVKNLNECLGIKEILNYIKPITEKETKKA